SPGALLHPGLLQESLPSPFSILEPTNGLALPGVHRPGSRASRTQIGHLAAASAVILYRKKIRRRRAWCLQELEGDDPQAKRMAAVSGALGSRALRLPVGGGGGGGPSATSGSYQPLPPSQSPPSNKIRRRRAWCLQELEGDDPQAKRMAAVSGALGSRALRLPVGGGGGGGPSATWGSYQPLPLFSLCIELSS
ncbi:hypothetical protein MC885_016558, partial [Smutsia gigantea]